MISESGHEFKVEMSNEIFNEDDGGAVIQGRQEGWTEGEEGGRERIQPSKERAVQLGR